MSRKTILAYDDLDSRRELYRLVGDPKMTSGSRMAFVRWCAARCGDSTVKVGLSQARGGYFAAECVNDLSMLTLQYRLDVDAALAELVRRVRRL